MYAEPPWVRGKKVCSQHLGHMAKRAAMPIYGINPSKIFLSNFLETWYVASETLSKKVKTVDLSETIAQYDRRAGRCRQLIEFMKACEY